MSPRPTGVDPSDELEIGAPYSFEPLDQDLAKVFIDSMEQSLGSMADFFEVGVKSAVVDGRSAAWVIVMRSPDIPVSGRVLLDAAAEGAAAGAKIEERQIEGHPVRIVKSEGIYSVMTVVDGALIMVLSGVKADGVEVATAILKAN